jgi:hypothetical protein
MSQANPTKSEIDKYASHYVLHGDQSASFREAFPDSKATKESINVKACNLHSLVNVQLRIDELKVQVREIAEEEFKIDAAWVLKAAKKVHDRCMQAEQVMVGGEPTGEYKFEAAGANKSLEIIGKHIDVQAFNENLSIKTGSEVTPWCEIKASVDNLKDDE